MPYLSKPSAEMFLAARGDPIDYTRHNPKEDRRDSYLEASKPLVNMPVS